MKLHYVCLLMACVILTSGNSNSLGRRNTTCQCGWINKGRIVGGRETRKNEYPLMVSIYVKFMESHVCGGTVLTPYHVLTAAHCFKFPGEDDLILYVGAHELNNDVGVQKISVAKIITHEDYDEDLDTNDIAIVVTKEQIKYSQTVGPACFPTSRLNLEGQKLIAIGWGLTTYRGKQANRLLAVDLPVISHSNCTKLWEDSKSPKRPKKESNICTFDLNKDTCKGDSGGPLLWLDPEINRLTIVGLVSYGSVCGGRRPAVNTDVTSYTEWVNNIITSTFPEQKTCTKI